MKQLILNEENFKSQVSVFAVDLNSVVGHFQTCMMFFELYHRFLIGSLGALQI